MPFPPDNVGKGDMFSSCLSGRLIVRLSVRSFVPPVRYC